MQMETGGNNEERPRGGQFIPFETGGLPAAAGPQSQEEITAPGGGPHGETPGTPHDPADDPAATYALPAEDPVLPPLELDAQEQNWLDSMMSEMDAYAAAPPFGLDRFVGVEADPEVSLEEYRRVFNAALNVTLDVPARLYGEYSKLFMDKNIAIIDVDGTPTPKVWLSRDLRYESPQGSVDIALNKRGATEFRFTDSSGGPVSYALYYQETNVDQAGERQGLFVHKDTHDPASLADAAGVALTRNERNVAEYVERTQYAKDIFRLKQIGISDPTVGLDELTYVFAEIGGQAKPPARTFDEVMDSAWADIVDPSPLPAYERRSAFELYEPLMYAYEDHVAVTGVGRDVVVRTRTVNNPADGSFTRTEVRTRRDRASQPSDQNQDTPPQRPLPRTEIIHSQPLDEATLDSLRRQGISGLPAHAGGRVEQQLSFNTIDNKLHVSVSHTVCLPSGEEYMASHRVATPTRHTVELLRNYLLIGDGMEPGMFPKKSPDEHPKS